MNHQWSGHSVLNVAPTRRPGAFVCKMTPEAERVWERMKRASLRGDHRQVKKQAVHLERIGREQRA